MTEKLVTILVVEDEALIRHAVVDDLEAAGFRVVEAANATDAVVLLIADPDIRAMFTDIDMPGGINGLLLAVDVRRRWPPIHIIVTSGQVQMRQSDMPVVGRFFGKPYDSNAVAAEFRSMLSVAQS